MRPLVPVLLGVVAATSLVGGVASARGGKPRIEGSPLAVFYEGPDGPGYAVALRATATPVAMHVAPVGQPATWGAPDVPEEIGTAAGARCTYLGNLGDTTAGLPPRLRDPEPHLRLRLAVTFAGRRRVLTTVRVVRGSVHGASDAPRFVRRLGCTSRDYVARHGRDARFPYTSPQCLPTHDGFDSRCVGVG